MVSWSRSFILAIKAVIYAVLWYVVGGIVFILGMFTAGVGFMYIGAKPQLPFISGTGILGMILMLVGLVIMFLGTTASVIKVAVDEAEKLRGYPQYSRHPLPPP